MKDKKQCVVETKKAQKLESLERILKKTPVLLEALLQKNCEDFLVCHPKGVHTQKVAPEKQRFAINK